MTRALLRCFAILLADRRGTSAVEYGLICALIVLAMVGALHQVASDTIGIWSNVSTKVVNAR